jgi:hypothetical protein
VGISFSREGLTTVNLKVALLGEGYLKIMQDDFIIYTSNDKEGRTYGHIDSKVISLAFSTKMRGDTQTDGETKTDIYTDSKVISQNKESRLKNSDSCLRLNDISVALKL